jgi:hypothetical protein
MSLRNESHFRSEQLWYSLNENKISWHFITLEAKDVTFLLVEILSCNRNTEKKEESVY